MGLISRVSSRTYRKSHKNDETNSNYSTKMAGIETLNPKAESAKQDVALEVTVSAATGVQNVIKSNLGPKGTLKMLVSGAGDIKLTKDGCVLLHEMAFQNPIASMIGKMATAQDDQTGDGTTSNIITIGELMRRGQDLILDVFIKMLLLLV